MIAVIADDLTGAAELAGIGLDHHLNTEVNIVVDPDTNADLLIVATNSRGLHEAEAKALSRQVTLQLLALKPQLIFKKIDSVLRGNILQEVEGQLEASGLKRALIIPGNPRHQKTVVNGVYYYKDEPVHQSAYALDPEYPVVSSDVKDMLRADEAVHLLKNGEQLPDTGVAVGDITGDADYDFWVNQLDKQTILVGAAGLFERLLKHHHPQAGNGEDQKQQLGSPRLFVFGSTFHQGKDRPEAGLRNANINFLPACVATSGFQACGDVAEFVWTVVNELKSGRDAIVAINPERFEGTSIDPAQLAANVADVVKAILKDAPVPELLIEGGATAAAIINKLGITRMHPEQQISPGVIRMSVPGNNQLYITLKPGSYEWPTLAWA